MTRCEHDYLPGYCYEASCPNADRDLRLEQTRKQRRADKRAEKRFAGGNQLAKLPLVRDRLARVEELSGLSLGDLRRNRRTSWLAQWRTVTYLALRDLGLSYPEIGRVLQRDHTTVMSGVRAAARLSGPVADAVRAEGWGR